MHTCTRTYRHIHTYTHRCPTNTDCIDTPYESCVGKGYVNAGSMFYAYGVPLASSSNCGYGKDKASDIYFVRDEGNNVYLVLQHDQPRNGNAGGMKLTIESSTLEPVFIAQADDPVSKSYGKDLGNTCRDKVTDCFSWDPKAGFGTFAWAWVDCCTDGMVLGPFPLEFIMEFNYRDGTTLSPRVYESRTYPLEPHSQGH